MSSPVRRAFNAARLAQKFVGGSKVIISRGLKSSGVVIATVGTSGTVTYEDDGSTLYTKNRDYYIDVADYIFEGESEPTTPARHDIITELVNGTSIDFQVTAVAAEDAYAYHGEQRNVFRIHTKEM